jgi:crossover junction endodeoxyribonuclease RuvC
MIILGIDPGTATTGFAIIKTGKKPGQFEPVDFGVITTKRGQSDAARLFMLDTDLKNLIKKYKPDRAGIEKLFFTTNRTTAITVAQARGIALLACEQNGIPIFEFTPLQVKSIICGYGKAEKRQVQFMVKQTFKLKTIPKPDDAADALAIALCAALANEKFISR